MKATEFVAKAVLKMTPVQVLGKSRNAAFAREAAFRNAVRLFLLHVRGYGW